MYLAIYIIYPVPIQMGVTMTERFGGIDCKSSPDQSTWEYMNELAEEGSMPDEGFLLENSEMKITTQVCLLLHFFPASRVSTEVSRGPILSNGPDKIKPSTQS